jgi:hypothetical protein
MHLLYCDESNMENRSGEFLLYGGVIVPPANARPLAEDIAAIRVRAMIPVTERVKFAPTPAGISHADYIAVKQGIIAAAIKHEAIFIAYAVLHDLANDPEKARMFGINTLCTHFNWILNRLGGPGLVLIDRINNPGNPVDELLREKAAIGVTGLPYTASMKLENIVGFHYASIGQSQFTSLSDILVSSLRFAINAHCRKAEGNRVSALEILRLLSPLFFREKGSTKVSELGFAFRPQSVKAPKYLGLYRDLQAFLAEGGVETAQGLG